MATTTAPSRSAGVADAPAKTGGRKINPGRVAAWTAMIILILITLFPFYWMIRTAFSTSRSLFSDPNSLLPVDFTLGAFKRVFGLATPAEAQAEGGSGAAVNFWLFLRNSIVYATLSTAGQVFFSALAAYAFARLRWPGRDKVFFIFLTALMIPPIFVMLPNFILIKNLGLLNTFPGLILPYFFMTPFAIFFLRQFFLNIPADVEEAAMLDGAGKIRIFWRVVLPMSKGPLITIGLITIVWSWKDYLWPLLVLPDPTLQPISVALPRVAKTTEISLQMSALFLAVLIPVVLFLLFQKQFLRGVGMAGGIKE